MAWTKNLGKIKGEDGDVYLPEVKIQDGKLHFGWEKKTAEEAMNIINNGTDLTIPVYVPSYDSETGNVTFSLSQTVKDASNVELLDKTFHIKGDTGETISVFDIRNFTENNVNDIQNPEPGVIYVKGKKAWIYNRDEEDFFMIEGLDLSNYYTINETYSKNEINSMFNEVSSQMELAYRLLEIEETILSNEELGE